MKKNKAVRVVYTDDLGEMDDFEGAAPLTRRQEAALGLPRPEEARGLELARKPARPARINIRLGPGTLGGLRVKAEELGMPYQTLASTVLHLVATGKLKLELVQN